MQSFDRLYQNLTSNDEWMEALHTADVIFVATHSQGCIVSTHLISRLISDGHIRTAHSNEDRVLNVAASVVSGMGAVPDAVGRHVQRVCCLGLCGIHLGPLAYLQKSSLVMPYIQVGIFLCPMGPCRNLTAPWRCSTLNLKQQRSYSNFRYTCAH